MSQDSPTNPVLLDDLLDSLRRVERQLDTIPDDYEQRVVLREQQRELRALAARLGRQSRSPTVVSRELDYLRRLREEVLTGHVSVGHVGGGNGPGGGGIEPRDVFAMNEAIDEAWGRAGLEDRIEKLEAELENLPEVGPGS